MTDAVNKSQTYSRAKGLRTSESNHRALRISSGIDVVSRETAASYQLSMQSPVGQLGLARNLNTARTLTAKNQMMLESIQSPSQTALPHILTSI
jgi:hypothetical protein